MKKSKAVSKGFLKKNLLGSSFLRRSYKNCVVSPEANLQENNAEELFQ